MPTIDLNDLRVTAATPVGTKLQPIKKKALIQLMGSRLWGRFNPNHWDPTYARATGLPGPIQTGEMTSAYLFEMCVNHFGAAMFSDARMHCKYIASTYADEVITTHGVIRDKQSTGSGFRFTVDLHCDNEAGEVKTVGFVEVTIEDREPSRGE